MNIKELYNELHLWGIHVYYYMYSTCICVLTCYSTYNVHVIHNVLYMCTNMHIMYTCNIVYCTLYSIMYSTCNTMYCAQCF